VAEKLRGRVFAYTPLNEPRITAWYCGRLGWWPPFRRGWRGFIAVMHAACRGIVRTVQTLRSVDPDILIAHVDATDHYASEDARLAAEVTQRQEIVFLALDLISGRIGPEHGLRPWLLRHGVSEAQLEWFRANAVELSLIGINLYPMFTLKVAQRTASGRLRWRMPYASGALVEQVGSMYWERYHAPLFISETASVGGVARRARWLEDSVSGVARLRERGVPLIGYTWWPMFALVTWGYRQGTHPPAYYLKQMGLWDLDARLDRIATPLVAQYRALVAGEAAAVGSIKEAQHVP
jgi:beta-glucosidase/6-phospho-beta-glucosidase/beta-galactosidase